MIEVDFGFDAKPARMRPQLAVAAIGADPHRLEHLDVAPPHRGVTTPALIDRRNESRSAAVHDRDFGTIHLDDRVVDAKAKERAKTCSVVEHGGAGFVAEHGSEFSGRHGTEVGRSSRSFSPLAPQRTKTMPVSACAGCSVTVAGQPEWTPMPRDRDWLAQGGLPASLHAPRHALHLLAGLLSAKLALATEADPILRVRRLCKETVVNSQSVNRQTPATATPPLIPHRRINHTGDTIARQLTVSYRVLPCCGRTLSAMRPSRLALSYIG